MLVDPYSAGASGERYNRLTLAGEGQVREALDMMAAGSEPYDDEFFLQFGRMRQALELREQAVRKLADGDTSLEVIDNINSSSEARQDAQRKLEDVAPERANARGQALIRSAAELNPFGKPRRDFEQQWVSEGVSRESSGLRKLADGPVADLLPASWLEASANHTRITPSLVEIDPAATDFASLELLRRYPTVDASYSSAGTPYSRLRTDSSDTALLRAVVSVKTSESTRTRLVLHEMCHRMEDSVPGLIEHEREHHRQRMPGAWNRETGEPLFELNYQDGAPDLIDASPPFFDEYLKQRLTLETNVIEAYEILSMSLENLFFGPRLGLPSELAEDPTTERFVLSLILGSLSR